VICIDRSQSTATFSGAKEVKLEDPEEDLGAQMKRHLVDDGGLPLIAPIGKPLLAPGGAGPVAEVHLPGTGFFVGESGALITNRHLALPWEANSGAGAVVPCST